MAARAVLGFVFATPIDWQAGLAWTAILLVVLGGVGALLGLVVIVVRSMFFQRDDGPEA